MYVQLIPKPLIISINVDVFILIENKLEWYEIMLCEFNKHLKYWELKKYMRCNLCNSTIF